LSNPNRGKSVYFYTFPYFFQKTPASYTLSIRCGCLSHIEEIKKAIGVSAVLTDISSWISRGTDKGAQIDLVIDRADRVVNLCEIKFAKGPFEIDRSYDLSLRDKIEIFRIETKTRKALHLTMITTYGVKPGKYSGLVQSEVILDELLQPMINKQQDY